MNNADQASGQTENTSGEDQTTNPINQSASSDTVAYGTHKKLLAEKKNLQARFEEMEKQFNNMNEDKLTSEGKKDELLEAYKAKNAAQAETINNFAYTSVSKDVLLEAQKMGCVDTTLLMKALDLSVLKNVTGDLTVDGDEVATLLESAKKSYPMLFKKEAPVVHDGVVKKGEATKGYAEELSACNTQGELEAVMKKHNRYNR